MHFLSSDEPRPWYICNSLEKQENFNGKHTNSAIYLRTTRYYSIKAEVLSTSTWSLIQWLLTLSGHKHFQVTGSVLPAHCFTWLLFNRNVVSCPGFLWCLVIEGVNRFSVLHLPNTFGTKSIGGSGKTKVTIHCLLFDW